MNIAFEATQLIGFSGINVYTRNLAANLAAQFPDDRYTLLTTYHKIQRVTQFFDVADSERLSFVNPFPNPMALGPLGRPLTEFFTRQKFRSVSRNFDLVHFTDPFHFPGTIPNAVTTVHDIIPLYPEQWADAPTRRRIRSKLEAIVRSKAMIFVPSYFVRNELLSTFDINPELVRVTYEAAGQEFCQIKVTDNDLSLLGIPAECDFFLYVGRIDVRKNIERLVEAYQQLPVELTERVRLVLIANGSPKADEQFQRDILGHPHIIHQRNISNAGLVTLLNRAIALTFVSLSEGFGIPLLEAMQCGCPVLTSNVSSMPEVAAEAALYVDPYSVSAIASALARLADDTQLRETLRASGLRRAAEFSWSKCAAETHAGYEAALGK